MLICPPLSTHHTHTPSLPSPSLPLLQHTHTHKYTYTLSHTLTLTSPHLTNSHTYTHEQYADYAVRLQQEIHDAGYHADVDESARTLNKKVRAYNSIMSWYKVTLFYQIWLFFWSNTNATQRNAPPSKTQHTSCWIFRWEMCFTL